MQEISSLFGTEQFNICSAKPKINSLPYLKSSKHAEIPGIVWVVDVSRVQIQLLHFELYSVLREVCLVLISFGPEKAIAYAYVHVGISRYNLLLATVLYHCTCLFVLTRC